MIARFVQVPKTSVHENNLSPARENDIWTARQRLPVNPISIPKGEKSFSHTDFGFGISVPDPAHALRAFSGCQRIEARHFLNEAMASDVEPQCRTGDVS